MESASTSTLPPNSEFTQIMNESKFQYDFCLDKLKDIRVDFLDGNHYVEAIARIFKELRDLEAEYDNAYPDDPEAQAR